MVRVKRKQDKYKLMAQQFTWGRHIGNLIIISVIGLLICTFLILQVKEEEMFATRGGIGAHALSPQTMTMVKKPHLIYGTAWKKDDTSDLVYKAVKTGFRFIDTACQPKHYNEAGVGLGWSSAAKDLGLERSDIWLQTKYTSVGGQDPTNFPYDPSSPIEEQVRSSLDVSLKNLKTTYLDSWVMHSPMKTMEKTMKAWRAMEEAVDQGKVRQLGMSNCYTLEEFKSIYQQARIKPAVLQNRFYADSDFDTELRKFCKDAGIQYQSFWTLSANRHALNKPEVKQMAKERGLTPQTFLYAFLMSLGYVTPLDGTTNQAHMTEDVALMKRLQGGEKLFDGESELRQFAKLLGMPEL